MGVRRRLSLVSFGCHVDLHGPTNKKLAGHLLIGVSLLVAAIAFHFVAAAAAAAAAVVVVAVFSIFIGRSRHPVTAETAIPDAIPAGCGAQYGARVVNHGRRDLWPVMKRRGFRAWLVCCGWVLFSFFFFLLVVLSWPLEWRIFASVTPNLSVRDCFHFHPRRCDYLDPSRSKIVCDHPTVISMTVYDS